MSKIEWHYTPKQGSCLNMAETESSVLAGQCLDRRMDSSDVFVTTEVAAWEEERNRLEAKMRWQFTVENARVNLEKLYLRIEWLDEKPSYERGPEKRNRYNFEPRTWQAFQAVAIDNRSPSDVATELHISIGAVSIAKTRVLKRLREELDGLV